MNYKDFFEEYKEMVGKYCIAIANVKVIKADGVFIIDCDLKECLWIMTGNFDSEHLAEDILKGDFPLEGVDKEGYWQVEMLYSYVRGDYEEPSYYDLLYSKVDFQMSFENYEKESKEGLSQTLSNLPF